MRRPAATEQPLPFFTWCAAAWVLLTAGCALPPPTQDKPLTGELDESVRVDSTLNASAEERSLPPAVKDAVSAPMEEAARVSSEAVAPASERDVAVNASGLERDPGAERPVVVNAPVVEADAADTVVSAQTDVLAQEALAEVGSGTAPVQDPTVSVTDVVISDKVIETSDGLSMHYRMAVSSAVGNSPVVFIHGWCGNQDQWAAHVNVVAKRQRVFTVDLVGHGRSMDERRAAWTIPKYGNDIIALLEAEKLENVVLVGHGMGGKIALTVAARVPERIGGIVGVDCFQSLGGDPDPTQVMAYVETFRGDYEGRMGAFVGDSVHETTSPDVRSRILRESLDVDREVALSLMEHFGAHDPRPAVRAIDCRVVCINSDTVATEVDNNQGLIPGFELVLIENVGHWVHLEAPDQFQERLLETLRRLEPAGSQEISAGFSPILFAEDVDALADFYVNKLGFVLVDRKPIDPNSKAGLISLERDGSSLVIQSPANVGKDFPGVDVPQGAGTMFLRVVSLDEEQKNFIEGVKVLVAARELPTGSWQIVIEDPVGNMIVLQERR